tara:strand:+ start:116 stop:817 length:702 start_codon:yes stop_codon:yes gene_type:complete
MTKAAIHHHLGLGDHIDCNGMIRYLMEKNEYEQLDVIAKHQYSEMVSYMYRDDKRIKVVSIDANNAEEEYSEVYLYRNLNPEKEFITVGHEYYREIPGEYKNCWEYFYEQMEMPHEIKVDYFKVEPDEAEEDRVFQKLNPDNEDFIFVHDICSYGKVDLNIDSNLKIIRNDISENIFHFTKILREAKEIHLMESSFKSMAEHFPTNGKLYFHNNREHPLGKTFKEWEILEYVS